MNILKYALLAEQGWEPINAFLDQKVSIFFRISKKHQTIGKVK
jgi:hypothetical protein